MSAPVLRLAGVRHVYRSGAAPLEILSAADLSIQAGEIVGLVGPSGAGKSTLLHIAGLLEKPTGGVVEIDAADCGKLSDTARTLIRREKLGFVYQFHHLLPEFTALDNAAAPLLVAGVAKAKAREEAGRLLTALGLGERLSHQPGQLSGGEQQRVAIARALANNPRLLIADEPTGNLDPATSGRVYRSLFDLSRQEGVAALIATHNLELTKLMDRVVTLDGGRIVPWSG